jgi:hypothetical protein
MKYFILWLMLLSRCNLHHPERIDQHNLPPHLLSHLFRHFGEAMRVEVEEFYRMKILMIRLQLLIWSKFLGTTRITKQTIRYLLARISRRERVCPIPSILPLSAVVKPRNYRERVSEAVP